MYILRKIIKQKHNIIIVISIVAISLFTLWSSFSLHFDGDSYLTLYRYQTSLKLAEFNNLTYFLTDYGPQDTIFSIIYNFFGFMPAFFYSISFILRLLAAFSMFPLVFYITKNKLASFISVIFFAITTIGLETTQWVFNMPSYIAIIFFNLFLYYFFRFTNKVNKKILLVSGAFFILTIIFQPIRMAFLPFLVISLTIYLLLTKKVKKNISIIIFSFFIILSLFIFFLSNIGSGVEVPIGTGNRIKYILSGKTSNNLSGLGEVIINKDYKIIFYPLGQIGNIIIPDEIIQSLDRTVFPLKILFKLIIPSIIAYLLILNFLKIFFINFSKKKFLVSYMLGVFWILINWYIFIFQAAYPLQISELVPMIVGGLSIVIFSLYYTSYYNKPIIKEGLLLSLLAVVLPFMVPWIKNPGIFQETINRYLIVSAVGFSILLGLITTMAKYQKIFLLLVIFPIFAIHLAGSITYLGHLANVRGYESTEKTRSSLPKIESFQDPSQPTIIYFETDNDEVLYHTLTFGFPVIIYYYQDVANVSNIVYTTGWSEIENYYSKGEGLERFGITSSKQANIDSFYSFNLKGNDLVDTTSLTRQKLLNINNETR